MTIANHLEKINKEMNLALERAGREAGSVTLVAVTKNCSISQIEQAMAAGQYHFGESYLQEALPKIAALKAYALQWHFIGAIQSNKTHLIAENFSWVHTICRQKIAKRLHAQRPEHLPPLNVCVQINISHEKTKSGLAPEAVLDFFSGFQQLSRLRLRGLMVIPKITRDFQQQLQVYTQVTTLFQRLIDLGWPLDTLSMGMSNDFCAAIQAGSTMIRIGSAIFSEKK
ncbi:MAG: YggS family pyridoxal phosphate enzyme [Coxiella sp. RIFCSPHIGHO2_12_FULL_44_14]|nr:MAG: YggS family pyridoxal phosphate enzyme [Coxiella sp. RIFCSPHIGHO2_12_FULL_44_14]